MPHGSPLFSRFFSIPAASTGNADSISTWCRRIPSMWSMCSMSTGHSSTHAPQFVQDHSTSGSITPFARRAHQRPSGLGLDRVGQLLALLIRGGQQVRRLGERVIAQVQDDLLGRQRLAGGPGRALRLAPPALGAGGHVQQALPGEVLDLAQAEHVGVRVGLLEVEHLAVRAHRLERAERVRPPGEQDVQRGQRDVQVLGVHHDDRKARTTASCARRNTTSSTLFTPVAERRQPVPDDLRGERAVVVGEHAGVDLRAPVQQQRRDDQEDHARARPTRRPVCEPKNRDARPSRCGSFRSRITVNVMIPASTADGEQVLQEADGRPVPDAGDRERPAEQVAVRLDDRQQQNDEAPERQGVRHARHRPLQQLALPDHLGRLRLQVMPGCSRTAAIRSGAGCPLNASRFSHHSRRPAIANATTVRTRPTVIRKTTRTSSISGAQA